jgi:hypothetical protein
MMMLILMLSAGWVVVLDFCCVLLVKKGFFLFSFGEGAQPPEGKTAGKSDQTIYSTPVSATSTSVVPVVLHQHTLLARRIVSKYGTVPYLVGLGGRTFGEFVLEKENKNQAVITNHKTFLSFAANAFLLPCPHCVP